ncbi:hypothetical protein BASA61_007079 [Batrachochytrium salamandrivorans]|nr:hypothetical protein BASA61_007079 [Batrachochytrium salamandrivorans]
MQGRVDYTDVAIIGTISALIGGFLFWRHCTSNASAKANPKTPETAPSSVASAVKPTSAPAAKKSLIAKATELSTDTGRLFLFFGSQTGTSEDLATRIAKEVSDTLGVASLVCDPEEYDMAELANWPNSGCKDLFSFFFSTYGEGEPTDNAADFYNWVMNGKGSGADAGDEEDEMTDGSILEGMSYAIFSLGNKTYEHYNAIGRRLDNRLTKLGATRVGEHGEGDDDSSLEEDFLAWKPYFMTALADYFGVSAMSSSTMRNRPHIPIFDVVDAEATDNLFLGELSSDKPRMWIRANTSESDGFEMVLNQQYKETAPATSYDAKHPFYSRLATSKPLFNNTSDTQEFSGAVMTTSNTPYWTVSGSKVSIQRQCYHMELDLSGSELTYQTGDHLGIWADNSSESVNRLAAALGIADLDRVIDLKPFPKSTQPNFKKPFPTPCTLRAALTNYVDISEIPKQFHLEVLGKYATVESEKQRLVELAEDRSQYTEVVQKGCKCLAQILEEFKSVKVPLGVVLVELLSRVAIRYYSISSSSAEDPTKLSITAVLVRYAIASPAALPKNKSDQKRTVIIREGVATSCLQRKHFASKHPEANQDVTTDVKKRCSVPLLYLPVCIRASTFRLPADVSTPILMVGPGTGVAPFRAFVLERIAAAKRGQSVGPTWLFSGCRSQGVDELYQKSLQL